MQMNEAGWSVDNEDFPERTTLHGSWALFLRSDDRARLARELDALDSPEDKTWDLTAAGQCGRVVVVAGLGEADPR